MRFLSFRKKYRKGWTIFCLVKTWRPIYATWNARLASADNLAEWIILDEQTFTEWRERARLDTTEPRDGLDGV